MLLEKLHTYNQSDVYPFHMPGHKRRLCLPADAYQLDITEVEGFDNLHHATGILLEEQERMAAFTGANISFFLVNGSTCGILTAISAVVPKGKKILVARNSHKAAYHALYLRELETEYLYPELLQWDIQGSIVPEQVEEALEANPDIQAVYLTSPTYDGVVSSIGQIADIVHAHGKILIVDEAHGAHFSLHPMFPASAIHKGADLVIQSVHKTLPAFTQSALLHVCSDRVDISRLTRFLGIYQSSSPSYVLMAGISRLVPFLEENGQELFGRLEENLRWFYHETKQLSHLHVISRREFRDAGAYDQDPSKIIISAANADINGKQLYDRLLRDYRLQMEMYAGESVTALCTLMDTREGFERLARALLEIDRTVGASKISKKFVGKIYRDRICCLPISKGLDQPTESLLWEDAKDRVSGEFAWLYPPGIPILVPGEQIDEGLLEDVRLLRERGMDLEGMEDLSGRRIRAGKGF